jgi:hypothetical protein
LDRILFATMMTVRQGKGAGLVALLALLPFAIVIGLAVLLLKGFLRGAEWCFSQAKRGTR